MRRLQTVNPVGRTCPETWDAPPAPAARPAPPDGYTIRDAAIERGARALYHEAVRQGRITDTRESWETYRHALPVFARDLREQAEAVLRAVGFR